MYDKYNRHRLTSLKLGRGKHNYLIGLEHNITKLQYTYIL